MLKRPGRELVIEVDKLLDVIGPEFFGRPHLLLGIRRNFAWTHSAPLDKCLDWN